MCVGRGWSGETYSEIPQMRMTLMRRCKGRQRRGEKSHLTEAREVNDSMGNLCYLVHMCMRVRWTKLLREPQKSDKADAFLDTIKPTKGENIKMWFYYIYYNIIYITLYIIICILHII